MEKVEFTQGILAIQPDLHRFAYKLTSDRDSANDLVQDCVLQALDNQEKFTYSKNLKGWMYTLLLTKILRISVYIHPFRFLLYVNFS